MAPLKASLDGFLRDKEAPRDFRDAKPAKGLERHGNLVLASERRMAAGEDHPELAVVERRVQEEVVDSLARCGAVGGPFLGHPALNLGAPQGVADLVLGHTMHPGRWVFRDAAAGQDCKASIKVAWTISSTRSKFRQPKKRVSTATSAPLRGGKNSPREERPVRAVPSSWWRTLGIGGPPSV